MTLVVIAFTLGLMQSPPPQIPIIIPTMAPFELAFEHDGSEIPIYRLWDTVGTALPKLIRTWTLIEIAAGKSPAPTIPADPITGAPAQYTYTLPVAGLARGTHIIAVEVYRQSEPTVTTKSDPLTLAIGIPIIAPSRLRVITTTTIIIGGD